VPTALNFPLHRHALQLRGLRLVGRRQAKPANKSAVEAASSVLHRAAVPFDRQVHLKFDRRRLRIGRVDMAEHLAEDWLAGAMRAAGVGARSDTAS
jgi:hypothetical protein